MIDIELCCYRSHQAMSIMGGNVKIDAERHDRRGRPERSANLGEAAVGE